MQSLELILRESARHHKHLCPRQVLGARMSLLAGEMLELELPLADLYPPINSATNKGPAKGGPSFPS
jgi:hypothetical protein